MGWNVSQDESIMMSDYEMYYSDNIDGTSRVNQSYSSNKLADDHRIATKQITPYITHKSSPAVGKMDSPWPMLCYDTHHTSQSPYVANDGNGLEKWRFRADGVDGGPVIDNNGNIYFGDKGRDIYAIDSEGFLNWKYETEGAITSTPALSNDGVLYVGSWDDHLYAFNASTGQLLWKRNAGGTIASSPIQALDGTIYVTTMGEAPGGHSLVAINTSGIIQWKYLTEHDITASPVLGDDGTIYFGGLDTYFYAINPNGTLKWRYKTGDWIKGPASIATDGTVYVYSWDDYLYAFYPDNGTVRWRTKLILGTETNPSIGTDGTIYVGGTSLWAIYPNGTIKWEYPLDPDFRIWMSCPAISADGIIYFGTYKVGSSAGDIMAINPDGTLNWKKRISGYYVLSSPCIGSDGTVYIGNMAEACRGYLHAFGPVESNSPPEKPTILGKVQGKAGEKYKYVFNAIDPDNNPIQYYIEWGDGSTSGWSPVLASGENSNYWHTYSEQGGYTIRCKAKDVFDEESDWGTLEISMPLTQPHSMYTILANHYPQLTQVIQLFNREISPTQIMNQSSMPPEYQQDYSVYMKMHAIDQLETTKVQDNLDKS
jgi:outer membrane protein assembly factor BamB